LGLKKRVKVNTRIKDKKIVRLPAELVRWFKPRRGEISSKERSPLYGANDFYKP